MKNNENNNKKVNNETVIELNKYNEKLVRENTDLNNKLIESNNRLVDVTSQLNETNNKLSETNNKLNEVNNQLDEANKEIALLKELLKLRRAEMFARKAEQKEYLQLSLFDEVELLNGQHELLEQVEEKEIIVKEHKRAVKKSANFINEIDESLFEKEVHHMTIDKDGYRDIHSDEIVKVLKFIPEKYVIQETHIHVYETVVNGERTLVRADNTLKNPLGKTAISPELLSNVIYNKVVNSLPLYRQEKELQLKHIPLTRQYLSNVIIKSLEIIKPVANEIKNYIVNSEVTRSDETPLTIIKGMANDTNKKQKYYIWAFSTGNGYKKATYYAVGNRSREVLMDNLKTNKRYLISDGYDAYLNVEGITNVLCWVHVRRKFTDVIKSLGPKSIQNATVSKYINLIAKMYATDNSIIDSCLGNYKKIEEERNQKLKPIIDSFFNEVDKDINNVLPKSLFGKALLYAQNNKAYLYNVLLDGRLELDNNESERKIKSIVIGRKNWMFSFTENGAIATCTYYSLLKTAIENNLNSEKYLLYLFNEFGTKVNLNPLDYLPWSEKIQKIFNKSIKSPII